MSVRARRIGSVRSETVAANYAFDPLEDDKIIRNRLLTRTTTTRGEPPLKKLQKKFTSFLVRGLRRRSKSLFAGIWRFHLRSSEIQIPSSMMKSESLKSSSLNIA